MAGVVAASGYAGELSVLPPPIDLEPIQFVLCWHRRNDVHPAQRWFRDCIASLDFAALTK
jgi:DNA-binding transcriptional LysR family regulator